MSGWGLLDRIRDELRAAQSAREEKEATASRPWSGWARESEAPDDGRPEDGREALAEADRDEASRDSWGWKGWRDRRDEEDADPEEEGDDDSESSDRPWRDTEDRDDDDKDHADDRDGGNDDDGDRFPWWRKPWKKDDGDDMRDDGADGHDPDGDEDDDDEDDEGDDGGMPPAGDVTLTAVDDTFTTDEDSVLSVPPDGVLANDSVSAGDFTLTAVNGNPANVGSELTLDPGATVTLNADGSLTFDPSGQFESLGVGEQAEVTFQYTISTAGTGNDGDTGGDEMDDGGDMDGGGGHGHAGWRWIKRQRREDDRRARGERDDDEDWRDREAREDRDRDWDWRARWGRRDDDDGDDDGDDGEQDDDGWRFRRERDDDDHDRRHREDREEHADWRARWREHWRRDDKHHKHKKDGKGDRDDDRDDDGPPDMGGGGQVRDTATVTIVVEGVNDDPVALADSGRTLEGFAIDIDVLGNDSDIDGDALRVESLTQPSKGSVAVNDDGTLAFDPGSDFDALNTGESETVTFTYTVADGNGGTDEAEVSVTVDGFDPGSQTNADLRNGVELSLTTAERTIDGTTDASGRISFPDVTFNLAFVVDVSNSTSAAFGGSPVGDQNGDGTADTILDAQIAALKNLSDGIANGIPLTDPAGQVDVGLVTFSGEPFGGDGDAALQGTFDPGDAELDAALEGLDSGGFTNFEAALRQTIDFFEDQPPADQNIVYFLSDGFPTLGGDFADEVAVLTDPAGIGATNVAVGVGTTSSVEQLDRIDTTGGTPQVTTSDELTAELLKPPFEVVDFSLEVGGTTVAGIDADSVTATPLGFTFDFADISGLDPTEGAETDLTATATIDSDGDVATTDDQFELSVTNTIAGVVPPELLMG